MKNTLTVLLLFCVAALGFFVYLQTASIKELQKEAATLAAKIEERTKTGNLDLQQKCAAQAHTQFVQSGFEKQAMAGYVNHYNEKANSCFMVISSTDTRTSPGRIFTNLMLLDAFEGKVFGNYAWQSDPAKKYWENPPFMCDVTLPSGEKKQCKSDAEFRELIKVYMGEMSSQ